MHTAMSAPALTGKSRPASRLLSRLRAHFARLGAAHAAARLHAALPAEAARDTGLEPQDLIGHPAQLEALPFFLQPGFASGERR